MSVKMTINPFTAHMKSQNANANADGIVKVL